MPASTNLFEARANWPIPPTEIPTVIKMEKTETPPRVAVIPYAIDLNKHQGNRPVEENVHGTHIAPFAKRKKRVQKTGMVTDRRARRGSTTAKMLNTPRPMTILIGFPNRSG